jgi:hypothetical protein
LSAKPTAAEPPQSEVPLAPWPGLANRYEPPVLTPNLTAAGIQSAFRLAESGDTRQLFALYRDLCAAGSHVQAQLGVRKIAVLGEPLTALPLDKTNKADQAAAAAVRRMIQDCENWHDGLLHLLDSVLWPVAVAEKVYMPAGDPGPDVPQLRYTLRRIQLVNPALLCFQPDPGAAPQHDTFEPDLRLYAVSDHGTPDWSWTGARSLDPMRHLVHRGHIFVGLRDNWGGPMRAVLAWWFIAQSGRDWWAGFMARFGCPYVVAKTDLRDRAAVALLEEALAANTILRGMVIDHKSSVELHAIATSGAADAYDKFISVCHREISKIILGQTLSAEAQPTGIGGTTATLHGDVREDIRKFDGLRLAASLERQLILPFLELNGLHGRVRLFWGQERTEADKITFLRDVYKAWLADATVSDLLANLTDLGVLTETVGLPRNKDYTEPYLPIRDDQGQLVTGEVSRDPQGDIVGGLSVPSVPSVPGTAGVSPEASQVPVPPQPPLKSQISNLESPPKQSLPPTAPITLHSPVARGLARFAAQQHVADQLGVPPAWLRPVADLLSQIELKAADKTLSDSDLLAALEQLAAKIPELFAEMDTAALADVLQSGMSAAVLDQLRQHYRQP